MTKRKVIFFGVGCVAVALGLFLVFARTKEESANLEPLAIFKDKTATPVHVGQGQGSAEPAVVIHRPSAEIPSGSSMEFEQVPTATTNVNTVLETEKAVTEKAGEILASTSNAQPAVTAFEAKASEQMYLAHASLRTPRVADPDSEENRRILQTMITKALTQAASTP